MSQQRDIRFRRQDLTKQDHVQILKEILNELRKIRKELKRANTNPEP